MAVFTIIGIASSVAFLYYFALGLRNGAKATTKRVADLKSRWGSRADELRQNKQQSGSQAQTEVTARVQMQSEDAVTADPPESNEPSNYTERCPKHERGWRVIEDGDVVEPCSFCRGRGSTVSDR